MASYGRIGGEDLGVNNMSRRAKKGNRRRKAGLNRSIADAGWGEFRRPCFGKRPRPAKLNRPRCARVFEA
ncbi:MAG TPA: hypothetical protein VN786_10570 [Acidimicrobiales bacterium]|nr:hypothetical protein [Acidimicrobiales bacterium]